MFLDPWHSRSVHWCGPLIHSWTFQSGRLCSPGLERGRECTVACPIFSLPSFRIRVSQDSWTSRIGPPIELFSAIVWLSLSSCPAFWEAFLPLSPGPSIEPVRCLLAYVCSRELFLSVSVLVRFVEA